MADWQKLSRRWKAVAEKADALYDADEHSERYEAAERALDKIEDEIVETPGNSPAAALLKLLVWQRHNEDYDASNFSTKAALGVLACLRQAEPAIVAPKLRYSGE